jgi:hypothetical protein
MNMAIEVTTHPKSVSPNTPELRCLLDVILSWRIEKLVSCAIARHGYKNSDGGFGIIYPIDLDDEDREDIAAGNVNIYGFWGFPDGDEFEISELLYLEVLGAFLRAHGRSEDAATVENLRLALSSGQVS